MCNIWQMMYKSHCAISILLELYPGCIFRIASVVNIVSIVSSIDIVTIISSVSIVGIVIIVSSVKYCKYCIQVHEKLLKIVLKKKRLEKLLNFNDFSGECLFTT